MSKEQRQALDQALSTWVQSDDIMRCDGCERFCLYGTLNLRIGSMRKEMRLCPECDLPEMWSCKYSKSRNRRYYIYFDPNNPSTSIVRWSHSNPDNPFHDPRDRGEIKSVLKKQCPRD